MQIEERELTISRPVEEVYKFLENPDNYLSGMSGVTYDEDEDCASFDVPGFGTIEAKIIERSKDDRIVIYSPDINTYLEVELYEGDDENETSIEITSKADPDCGILKNMLIKASIPRLLDKLVKHLEEQNI